LNLAGATLGATAAFLVARYVAADWARRKAGARLDRLIKGVEAEGWRFVALMRLVPLVPFNLLNYALGLTRIPVGTYVLTSAICMAPGALAYTWLGHAGREAVAGNDAAIRYGLVALALLAAVAFLPRLARRLMGDLRGDADVRWIEVGALAPRLAGREAVAVIDVRGPDEFTGPLGHIPDARNLPLGELPARLQELGSLADKPVVLVCMTDRRSARAAAVLDAAGFRDVSVLRGGMVRWNEEGLPVARR
jgi:rhodanese-related sulfurtransferase